MHAVRSLAGVVDVAITPNGTAAYAVSFRNDAILQFRRAATGALSPLGLVKFETAGGSTVHQPTSVVVSPDGRNLCATFSNPRAIVVMRRSPHVLAVSQCIVETVLTAAAATHRVSVARSTSRSRGPAATGG